MHVCIYIKYVYMYVCMYVCFIFLYINTVSKYQFNLFISPCIQMADAVKLALLYSHQASQKDKRK